ncbi:MAG TPA: hypothetical protein VNM14_19335 [Planctomycetota bacterium]|jgi:outer membrane biogenesis lipoprotein LolB|nr:hypothetical protein [Planctomycetota bacterium]
MRRMLGAAMTLLLLSGCNAGEKQTYTLLPYGSEDEVWEIVGKTIVNVPVWTLEGALGITVLAMYLGALAGYRR